MGRPTMPDWPRGMKEETVAAYIGVSTSTVRNLRAFGDFPQPVSLTQRRLVWLREHVDAWLDKKAGGKNPVDDWPDAE